MLADHEQELMDNWRGCCGDLERLHHRTADNLLRSVKFRVMDRIIGLAGKHACLSGYDDNLFECCKVLTGLYEQAVDYYERHKADLNRLPIQTRIPGIIDALNARLRLYKEYQCSDGENPVAIERIKLLGAGVAYFMFSFDETGQVYKNARLRASELAGCFTPEYFAIYIERIQGDVLDNFFDKHYQAYCKSVRECLANLNDLNNRRILSHYYTLLTGEHDVISYLARQGSVIENELARCAANSFELEIVQSFLSIVNEAQSYYNSEEHGLIAVFSGIGGCASPEPESVGPLRAACEEMLVNSRLISHKDYIKTSEKYNADIQLIIGCLADNSDRFISQVFARANLKGLQLESERKINDWSFLIKQTAESIASIFARQVSFYREHNDYLSILNEDVILKGINETLLIKVEILAENITAFDERRKAIAGNLPGEEILANDKERIQLLEEMFLILQGIFVTETDNNEQILDALYNAAAETGPVAAYRQRVSGSCQKAEEQAEKGILRFFKESVLYEISTFEEILQYSVSRLRESDNDYVKNYIDLIDESARKIEAILNRIGITMIRPNPHDIFNGKEHEVLMAEHIEGFTKGEIIKSITSGYKLNNQILVRANIIAAK